MANIKSKYRAVKVQTDEGTFDSKKEYTRWLFLKQQEADGKIRDLQRQVRFEVLPEQREVGWIDAKGRAHKGRLLERKIEYIADFCYFRGDTYCVEDAKGVKTPEYVIKRKLMLWMHHIEIMEV